MLKRGLVLIGWIWVATITGVVGFTMLWPVLEPTPSKADLIVILGGGMDPDGRLHVSSKTRVDRAIDLWREGAAPRLHFTGGRTAVVSAGQSMAARAIAAGVPENVITTENLSQSTLQNALFSKPYTKDARRIILVTQTFHLPRAWASMKVFGAQKVTLVHAPGGHRSVLGWTRMILRETLAIWFNAVRLVVWWVAGAENHDLLY
ncbi:MAG: YdcF family protein [Pseudomonadota bacterium]